MPLQITITTVQGLLLVVGLALAIFSQFDKKIGPVPSIPKKKRQEVLYFGLGCIAVSILLYSKHEPILLAVEKLNH